MYGKTWRQKGAGPETHDFSTDFAASCTRRSRCLFVFQGRPRIREHAGKNIRPPARSKYSAPTESSWSIRVKELNMNQIEFEVGGKYENMKGVYEVLSMGEDTMHIRWENGEEVTTEIDFQRRIIERMEFERQQQIEKKAKKAKKAAGGRVKFEGLKESDFSKKVSGTTWRRRSCLGGAVKVFADSDRFDVKSWSIARKLIQWADVQHRDPDIFNLQSKFFVRLNEDNLFCGYCIERSVGGDGARGDWEAFLGYMLDSENEKRFKDLAFDRKLSIYQLNKDGEVAWKVYSTGETWMIDRKGAEKPLETLGGFLEEFSGAARRVDLSIAKAIDKEEAISRGVEIADDISHVFEVLFPIYEASVSNGSPA
jgi:hypothetical protein